MIDVIYNSYLENYSPNQSYMVAGFRTKIHCKNVCYQAVVVVDMAPGSATKVKRTFLNMLDPYMAQLDNKVIKFKFKPIKLQLFAYLGARPRTRDTCH